MTNSATDPRPPWNLWLPLVVGGVYMGGQIVVGILTLAIYWLSTLAAGSEPSLAAFAEGPLIVWVALGAAAISGAAALVLVWVLLRPRVERPFVALGFVRGRRWLLMLTPALTILVMMLVSASVAGLFGLDEISVDTQEMLFQTPSLGIASLIVAITIAPATEEILFRSLLYEPVQHRLGKGWAVVISAALFAGAHLLMVGAGEAVLALFMVWFALGVFLGALRAQTGTLWGPMLSHLTWNVIASIAALAAFQ